MRFLSSTTTLRQRKLRQKAGLKMSLLALLGCLGYRLAQLPSFWLASPLVPSPPAGSQLTTTFGHWWTYSILTSETKDVPHTQHCLSFVGGPTQSPNLQTSTQISAWATALSRMWTDIYAYMLSAEVSKLCNMVCNSYLVPGPCSLRLLEAPARTCCCFPLLPRAIDGVDQQLSPTQWQLGKSWFQEAILYTEILLKTNEKM